MNDFIEELEWRGLIHQVTEPALGQLMNAERFTGYVGFDPTADSLHIGSLVPLLGLRRLQVAGHRPIALAGGGTGMVGDPSFRATERALLTEEQIDSNIRGIRGQLEKFLDFSTGSSGAILENNGEWLGTQPLLGFLRDVGKHFSVNQMISKEAVKTRLTEREQGISFTEFSYALLQSYDFLHLYDAYGCRLQLGGSDQYGNITSGIDYVRRVRSATVYGLTSPLLTKSDGSKFGKSEAGNVWLDPSKTSPYAFYQFLVRVDDADTGRLLRTLTFLSKSEIEDLDRRTESAPEKREAQRALARAVTALVHGEPETRRVEHAAAALFSEDIGSLDEPTLLEVFEDAPSSQLTRTELTKGIDFVDLLTRSGLVQSRSEGRKAVEQGGGYLNNRRVRDIGKRVTLDDVLQGRYVVIRKGKRDYHLVRVV